MFNKYIAVAPDHVPKDLPHNTKFVVKFISEEGIMMGDPELRHAKNDYYEINISSLAGSLKTGSRIKNVGKILCWVFSSEKKAIEHVLFYRNNPRYEKNVYKKFVIVKVINLFNFISVRLAFRAVLKKNYKYASLYGGFPFVRAFTRLKK